MNHFFESTRDKRTKVRDGKGGEEGDSSGNFIRVTSTVGQTTRYQASRMSTVRVPFPFPIANGSSRFFATPLDPSLWLSTTRCFLHTGKPIRANLPRQIQGNDPRKQLHRILLRIDRSPLKHEHEWEIVDERGLRGTKISE